MMKAFKQILTGIVIGILLGLWFGVNIGKDRPIFSNPFAERNVTQKLKSSIGEGVEKTGESIEKLGKDMKDN
jgi:hypothetical protein